ncbi:2-amino-4-hydroxy-6-hydroxymethyldihydropteridine diphosphokinase [Thioalkalivibrio sp.]|uniref:2-amino-4-hydroxy-6- hydroxymethyldihydropteridine diphosphokinase n=1 Tax=Thioalkalivibrio sp. TaxID=2093813 RepID=UPI00356A4109
MTRAWIGLGSNLGASADTLCRATRAIDALPDTRLVACSPVYRTPPWGVTDQPDFLNAVAELETALDCSTLLERLLGIETDFGRRRAGPRWGPRVLDLDVLVFGSEVIQTAGLQVPHPGLAERAFVLVPLNDLAPELNVPGRGLVKQLLAALPAEERDGVRPLNPRQS